MLEIGRISKPHGLRGEVIVELVTNRTERLEPGAELFVGDRVLVVTSSSPHQGRWIVRFAGVDDRTAADALRGAVLSAPPLEDPSVLWVHDLIGSTVFDIGGTERGRVVSVVANPASDLLELESGELIPVRFVASSTDGRIVVDVPSGL